MRWGISIYDASSPSCSRFYIFCALFPFVLNINFPRMFSSLICVQVASFLCFILHYEINTWSVGRLVGCLICRWVCWLLAAAGYVRSWGGDCSSHVAQERWWGELESANCSRFCVTREFVLACLRCYEYIGQSGDYYYVIVIYRIIRNVSFENKTRSKKYQRILLLPHRKHTRSKLQRSLS